MTQEEYVALRKESVDRNVNAFVTVQYQLGSLSARRAWIEIRLALSYWACDRCRSPQGERG